MLTICALSQYCESSSGMQQLLHICNKYAAEHQLLYNGSKSFSLCFKRKELKVSSPPFFFGKSKKNSDLDLKQQMRKMYTNANLLLRKFSKCSINVKCYLFKTYCSNLYCAPMWFDCTKTDLKKLKVAYNNSLRRFMGLLWHNSAREMCVNLNIR